MKKNQNGFSAIEGLLVLVVGVLIGFGGWYVWQQHQNTPTLTNNSQPNQILFNGKNGKSLNDTTKTFAIAYPSDWTVKKYVYQPCCEGSPKPESDWSKVPQPITLVPKNTPKDVEIIINANNTGANTLDKAWLNRTIDKFNTYDKFQVNGYDALDNTLDFVGPTASEAYTDHRDTIFHNKSSVEIYFREKYRNNLASENNFNASNDMYIFNAIVYSVKFLK